MQRANVIRGVSVALFVVVAAVFVAACGELPVGEAGVRVGPASEAQQGSGLLRVPQGTAKLTQADVCVDASAPSCTPTGAHGKHDAFDCKECHFVGGRLAFKVSGLAYGSGWTSAKPRPGFDATPGVKTCSNVACHGVPAGTFSFYFPGGDGEPVLNTVNVYGNTTGVTPSWYATGSTCTGCHPNPPRNGTDGSNVWHSGNHGNQGPTGARNQCQFCHPDATGSNGVGTAITSPALHGNGVYNVQASFTSACFSCH